MAEWESKQTTYAPPTAEEQVIVLHKEIIRLREDFARFVEAVRGRNRTNASQDRLSELIQIYDEMDV